MSTPSKQLRTLTSDEINAAYKKQIEQGDWSFTNEREFMESLFCERFNFLLVAYSLIVTACASTEKIGLLKIVLVLGFLICLLTSLSIWRAYAKLIIVLRICYLINDHPVGYIDRENKKWPWWRRGVSVNHFLGVWIPWGCTASLAAAWVLVSLGNWNPFE